MKTVLCYGDSLTWGADPATGGRHAYVDRWPSALGTGLGADKVRVIADGLPGRTTVFDDHTHIADRNGARILPTVLATHQPVDAVLIMLGTNDLKPAMAGTAHQAAMGIKRLVQIVRSFPYNEGVAVPEIVIVAPPRCVETDHIDLAPMFAGAAVESGEFAVHYARIARELSCAYFDAGEVATASSLDGVHLDAQNTIAIGAGLVPVVEELLNL